MRTPSATDSVEALNAGFQFVPPPDYSPPLEALRRLLQLLNDLADPHRGFEAVVIGEPARAFYGFRSAMEAMAADGSRFLGGRPPYGYQLVDAGPHPNPTNSTAGQRLHRLEADPITAPVVGRMLEMYADGAGLRLIADTLTAGGIPSTAPYDRRRNPHRDPRGWAHTAVRAILANPIYGGRKVWGTQQRHEELLDVTDVAAGHITRMRWRPDSQWIAAETNPTPALVGPELAARVAARFGQGPARTKARDTKHAYLLRGLLYCGLCGRMLQGSARRPRTTGLPARVLYRCEVGSHRSSPPGSITCQRCTYGRTPSCRSSTPGWPR